MQRSDTHNRHATKVRRKCCNDRTALILYVIGTEKLPLKNNRSNNALNLRPIIPNDAQDHRCDATKKKVKEKNSCKFFYWPHSHFSAQFARTMYVSSEQSAVGRAKRNATVHGATITLSNNVINQPEQSSQQESGSGRVREEARFKVLRTPAEPIACGACAAGASSDVESDRQ